MSKPLIGIIGAGKLGITLAQLADKAGYPVLIANSRDPESIAFTLDILAPAAQPIKIAELLAQAEIIVLALPLGKYRQLPAEAFKEKIVIDAMNYWWEVDGKETTYSDQSASSSERVQSYFTQSKVIKAFNHMGYHDLTDEAVFDTEKKRKVIAYAGENSAALEKVRQLIQDLGFDPFYLGSLATGRVLEPGTPLFGANLSRELFAQALSQKAN